ncbi:hypothetical protein AERO9AM_10291 [Aeromicrobium sp. 9AM]|nr:hypothetical protein AERO9AM_10291 [Aeromicrobium sp. 9AM]
MIETKWPTRDGPRAKELLDVVLEPLHPPTVAFATNVDGHVREQFRDANDVALHQLIFPAFVGLKTTDGNGNSPPCRAPEQLLCAHRLPHPLSPHMLAILGTRTATKGTAKRSSRRHFASVTTRKRSTSDLWNAANRSAPHGKQGST